MVVGTLAPGYCDLGSFKTQVPETPQHFHFLRSINPQTTRGLDTIPPSDDESRSLVCVWSFFSVSILRSFSLSVAVSGVFRRVLTWHFSRASLSIQPSPFFEKKKKAAMARKLRSSSRPSTPFEPPAGATTRPSSAADVSRPRKLRRTGLSSRVASDPPQGSQSQSEQAGPEEHDKPVTGWIEPPLRPPQPSYMDTPWSAMSSVANPVLASMRPLGSMPTAADFRKVGLEPRKSKPKRVAQPVQNGAQDDASGQNGDVGGDKTPENAVEGTASAAAPASPEHGTQKKDHLNTFATVPLPASAEFDVDKIKGAIEDALRKSIETGNQAVARALLHVWENTTKDNSTLSILDGMCRETPTINETSAFKTAVRSAWDGFQADDTESDEQPPAMTRTHSASSVSSLSPAKSLDADTFAPGVSTNTRSRTKGKQPRASKAKAKAPAPAPPPRRSLFPSMTERSQQRRRLMDEDPDFSDDALAAKREHLQKDLPELDVPESKIRGSLAKSNFSGRNFGSRATSGGARVTGRESRESSEAPDNRRLTSSYVPLPSPLFLAARRCVAGLFPFFFYDSGVFLTSPK